MHLIGSWFRKTFFKTLKLTVWISGRRAFQERNINEALEGALSWLIQGTARNPVCLERGEKVIRTEEMYRLIAKTLGLESIFQMLTLKCPYDIQVEVLSRDLGTQV